VDTRNLSVPPPLVLSPSLLEFETGSSAVRARMRFVPIPQSLAPRAILPYIPNMNITLPPNQRKWLEAEVAAGRFASLEEALAVAVSGLMELETDDLAWARPQVDKARASFAEGDVSAGEASLQRLDDRIAKLQSS
jgi:antitoxin ParD1/3/4